MKMRSSSFRLLFPASCLVASLSAQAQAETATGRLGSTVFHYATLTAKPTGVGARRDVTDRPTATLERLESHVSVLLPGRISHPPHQHPQEEVIILREGTLEVTINGVAQRAGPGSLLFFAANDWHNVRNIGDTPARYVVFNFATAATRTLAGKSATQLVVPGKLGSTVFDWGQLAVKPTKTGERREVANAPTTTLANFECHVTTLNAGEVPHVPHHHPDDEVILMRDGQVDVTVNGVTSRAGPDDIFFFSSNDEHGLRNMGGTAASYYVIRVVTDTTPAPAKA